MKENQYSLTFPQKNIWLVEKFNPESSINMIAGSFKISKDFNTGVCNKAVNYLIEKNDALRLQVRQFGAEVIQYVNEFKYKQFEVVDMSMCSQEEIENCTNDYILQPIFF